MGQANSKAEGAAVGGTVGGAAIATGVGLMFLGPVGWAFGGVLIGAGVSSTVNTVEQCVKNEGDTFSYGDWGKNVGIGAAGGAIAAPFSAAGGVAAAAIGSTSGKVATVVAAETIGGAVSGGSTNVISKRASGEDVSLKDFGKGALVGGVAGVAAGATGQAAQRGATALTRGAGKTVGSQVSKRAQAVRVGTGTVGGAVGGAGGAVLGKIVENLLYQGELTLEDFLTIMTEQDIDLEDAMELWEFLCDNEIIVDDVVQQKIPSYLEFPEDLEYLEEEVRKLIDLTYVSVTEGIGRVALEGSVTGGLMGATSAGAEIHQQKKTISKHGQARGRQMMTQGKWAGSIESEAFARLYNKRLVVLHTDGTYKTYGSRSAKKEVYLYYDAFEQHYIPVDAHGRKLLQGGKSGDCFFESLAYHTGESASEVRQRISKYIHDNPHKLKDTHVNELERGGTDLGGGKRDYGRQVEITEGDTKKALAYFDTTNHPELKKNAQLALRELQNLTKKELHQMEQHTGNTGSIRKGTHHIHALGGLAEGFLSVDVYPHTTTSAAPKQGRGVVRMLFKRGKGSRLEYVDSTNSHSYDDMLRSYFGKKGMHQHLSKLDERKK